MTTSIAPNILSRFTSAENRDPKWMITVHIPLKKQLQSGPKPTELLLHLRGFPQFVETRAKTLKLAPDKKNCTGATNFLASVQFFTVVGNWWLSFCFTILCASILLWASQAGRQPLNFDQVEWRRSQLSGADTESTLLYRRFADKCANNIRSAKRV